MPREKCAGNSKGARSPRSCPMSSRIEPSVTLVGRLPAVEIWNLSDPKRVALLYLQHGRRLRLPAPKALMDDAVKRARAAE